MKSGDVTDTLDLALQASGCDQATVLHKPRLLSDNGSSYISSELADWLDDQQMDRPVSSANSGEDRAMAPDLEELHLAEKHYLPGDLRQQIDAFVYHYNHRRYHESLQNLTPADVYFGRGRTILKQQERIKRKTVETRRLLHHKSAA